jgi:hypothetical protein
MGKGKFRALFAFLALICGLADLHGQMAAKGTSDDEQINGKIKSYTLFDVIFAESSGSWAEQAKFKAITQNFDMNGRLTETYIYNMDGSVKSVGKFTYDSKGNKTEESGYNASNVLLFKTAYTYDTAGHVLAKSVYNSQNMVLDKTKYSYDAKGNLAEERQYQGDGTLRCILVCAYDNSGKLRDKSEYRPDGALVLTTRWQYDNRGYLKEVSEITPNETVLSRKLYYLDTDTNISDIDCLNRQGVSEYKISYAYDTKNNWVRKIRSKPAKASGNTSYNPYAGEYRTIEYY